MSANPSFAGMLAPHSNVPVMVPAFRVVPEVRMVETTLTRKDESGFVKEVVSKKEYGYMVYTRRGDSVYIKDIAELRRLGCDKVVPIMIDGNDEPVGYMPPVNLEHKIVDLEAATAAAETEPKKKG